MVFMFSCIIKFSGWHGKFMATAAWEVGFFFHFSYSLVSVDCIRTCLFVFLASLL